MSTSCCGWMCCPAWLRGAYTAVVAPVAAACQLTMPPAELLGRTRTVKVGG